MLWTAWGFLTRVHSSTMGIRRAHIYLYMKEPWICWVCLSTTIPKQWRTVVPALNPVQHVPLLRGWGGEKICPVYSTICSVQPNHLILTNFKGNEVKTSEVTLTLHKIFAVSDVMKKRLFQRSRDHLPGFLLTPKCTSFSFSNTRKPITPGSLAAAGTHPYILLQLPQHCSFRDTSYLWFMCSSSYPYLTSCVPRMHLCTLRDLCHPGKVFHCHTSYNQLGFPLPIPPRPYWGGSHLGPIPGSPSVLPCPDLLQMYSESAINWLPSTS